MWSRRPPPIIMSYTTTENVMDFDTADYTMYLEYEREALTAELNREIAAEATTEDVLLEVEVMMMMEML